MWRFFHRPRGEHPSEFLGLVPGDTKADALKTAYAAWPGKTFDCVSETAWDAMGPKAQAFFTGTHYATVVGYTEIAHNLRSAPCQVCGVGVTYKQQRNGNWRKPPEFCPQHEPPPSKEALRMRRRKQKNRPATASPTDV